MTAPANNPTAALPDSAIDDEALEWFVHRMGSHADSDDQALLAWLAASPAHRRAYARWEEEWLALDAIQTEAIARSAQPAAQSSRRRTRRWVGAALTCCGMFAAVALWFRPETPQYTHHYATHIGEQVDIALPDGSAITLDADTSLDVSLFAGRRRVTLPEGQAVFHVRADATRPFEVIAGPARITVLGTRFAVRHTPGSSAYPGVHIAVESGHVQVAATTSRSWRTLWREAQSSPPVELLQGQQLTLSTTGSPGPVTPVDAASIAAWRRRQLSFDNITLQDALAEFARYGSVNAQIRDHNVASLKVTGTFDADNPQAFYRLIAKVLPVRIQQTTKGPLIEANS